MCDDLSDLLGVMPGGFLSALYINWPITEDLSLAKYHEWYFFVNSKACSGCSITPGEHWHSYTHVLDLKLDHGEKITLKCLKYMLNKLEIL